MVSLGEYKMAVYTGYRHGFNRRIQDSGVYRFDMVSLGEYKMAVYTG